MRARVAQLQAEIAERAVEIAAIDKSWVMRRLQENVERAMSIEPVLDGKGHPTVYDPEPAEEPLPGTVKGMGIEVGINARPLWPGGVLVDALHAAEAMRRTKALIAGPTVPAIFEARSAR